MAEDIQAARTKAIDVIEQLDSDTLHEITVLYGKRFNKRDTIEEYNKALDEAEKNIAEGKTHTHEEVLEYFNQWQKENPSIAVETRDIHIEKAKVLELLKELEPNSLHEIAILYGEYNKIYDKISEEERAEILREAGEGSFYYSAHVIEFVVDRWREKHQKINAE